MCMQNMPNMCIHMHVYMLAWALSYCASCSHELLLLSELIFRCPLCARALDLRVILTPVVNYTLIHAENCAQNQLTWILTPCFFIINFFFAILWKFGFNYYNSDIVTWLSNHKVTSQFVDKKRVTDFLLRHHCAYRNVCTYVCMYFYSRFA